MKKKLIVWALLLSLVLTACGPAANTGASTESTPSEWTSIPVATEPSIQIHYQRTEDDYDQWGFWIWQQGGEGAVYEMNYRDEFGGVAVYPLSAFGSECLSRGIGVIPRRLDSWTKDGESDRLISFSDYQMDDNNYYHLYIKQGDIDVYMDQYLTKTAAITEASLTAMDQISVKTNLPMLKTAVYEDGVLLCQQDVAEKTGVTLQLEQSVVLGKDYQVEVTFADSGDVKKAALSFQKLYTTTQFNDLYYYDGALGAIYSKTQTEFKVWSPVSTSIAVNLYDRGDGGQKLLSQEMVRGDKGVFSLTLEGDLAGKYYTYTVVNSRYPQGVEIVDPYAKSAGLNGLRGMIVDFDLTDPDGWESVSPIAYDRKELVVWETHVADVTSSKTWEGNENWRKKFLGMIQEGTTYTENGVTVTTGFDHIKELGVNAVQLVPIFDQANDETNVKFNWGYNPLNYNVLEGAYATDAQDGYVRIREFKQLVQAYNEAGINIIMDVVYNHVNSANGSNFDVLMPGYYFRYNGDGTLSNGSGCGNETASDNLMMRKFIIDSVCFWAEEYKLGGFRFDLMGLHDIETMNELAKALKQINPDIVIYGEPWTGGSSTLNSNQQAVQSNANLLEGVGQFNDQMRDALIKGGLNAKSSKGWITNKDYVLETDVAKILQGLQGATNSYVTNPDRTVNYVTCHDNYTLYDRIKAAGITDETTIQKMAVLANSVVLTSNGTSFLLAGEEFLRTKGGDDNSYESSYEVNELNYGLKIQNAQVFETYKALIAFKKNTASLHLQEGEMSAYQVEALANGAVIKISFNEQGKTYVIYHANGTVKDFVADLEGYSLVLDTLGGTTLTASTAIGAYQTLIASK